MPMKVFEAMSGNISSFLGGAEVALVPAGEELPASDNCLRLPVGSDGERFLFHATRNAIPFTRSEEASAASC